METSLNDFDAFRGRRAIDWLFGREDGGRFFDAAMVGVSDSFGREAAISAFVPLNWRADPLGFFFQVAGHVDDDGDWNRLVRAHEILLLSMPSRSKRRDFSDFHLVLEANPLGAIPLDQADSVWRS